MIRTRAFQTRKQAFVGTCAAHRRNAPAAAILLRTGTSAPTQWACRRRCRYTICRILVPLGVAEMAGTGDWQRRPLVPNACQNTGQSTDPLNASIDASMCCNAHAQPHADTRGGNTNVSMRNVYTQVYMHTCLVCTCLCTSPYTSPHNSPHHSPHARSYACP